MSFAGFGVGRGRGGGGGGCEERNGLNVSGYSVSHLKLFFHSKEGSL